MTKKRFIKFRFTLLEVTVALAVLSLLLMVLMRFFTTAQDAWTRAEKRNNAYADSRAYFDLMDSALQSSSTVNPDSSFSLNTNLLSFSAVLPYLNSGVRTLSSQITFGQYFVDDENDSTTDTEEYYNGKAGIAYDSTDATTIQPVIDNVIELSFIYKDSNWSTITTSSSVNSRPAIVEVTIKMFGNRRDFIRWAELNDLDEETPDTSDDSDRTTADEFFEKEGFLFTRVFTLPVY